MAVAISNTTGSLFFLGHAIEIGFVPKKASFPPAGATEGLKAVQAKPTRLCPAKYSVSGQSAAK